MSGIDLLSIQPHQVSRDLRGYSVFLYGEAKSGKTTTASKFPDALILGFEKGWNALPGVMVQPVNSWSEFKKVLRQLKDEEVKKKFSTIIIDTVDICYDACEKYICDNAKRPDGGCGVDTIADIGFGKGFAMAAKEFDEALRSIVQMNYGLVMISHAQDKTFKDEQGQEYNQIVPTLGNKPRNIVSRMADIIGYSRIIDTDNGQSTKLFMRGTPRYVAGSRFKYTPDYIDFNYKELVNAIGDAIDKQAAEDGAEYFTDERVNLHSPIIQELDFDNLMKDFNDIIDNLIQNTEDSKFKEYWQPRIVQITDQYLGKGQLVSKMSRDQVEALDLIVTDLKELVK